MPEQFCLSDIFFHFNLPVYVLSVVEPIPSVSKQKNVFLTCKYHYKYQHFYYVSLKSIH